jgi:hypothetical protein
MRFLGTMSLFDLEQIGKSNGAGSLLEQPTHGASRPRRPRYK